ncbi:MAG TPA: Na+/Pi-cotransporter [Bacteroidales bacterium]|nr:Na+/Pi-cotransporter [Bacteroidales bacterium]
MNTLTHILSLVGSLGLFLYGMKLMSEGLQKFAGERLRQILGGMTRNRIVGVVTGIVITVLIQSSMATTVMVVSFVNAGLMTLLQSIGVIMGANIGTTASAWLISAIGFNINIAAFALPLMAIGMPFLYFGNSRYKSLGEFFLGFAFLFMGLSFLQDSSVALHVDTALAALLAHVSSGNFWCIMLFVLIGAVITMLLQSSVVAMAITLMLYDMNIPGFSFELAAALVMGLNLGTTLTANIAALSGNTSARRAALVHFLFNFVGVVLVLPIFQPFIRAVQWCVTDMLGMTENMFQLSMFHTAFNVLNTLVLIWFVKPIEKLVCWIIPNKDNEEEYRLKFISKGLLSTSELSILQAWQEIESFAERTQRMFGMVKELYAADSNTDFVRIFSRIEKYEGICDRMEIEIAEYLNKVADGRLSDHSKQELHAMLRIVSELESVGDACYNMSRTIRHKHETKQNYDGYIDTNLEAMFALADQALEQMVKVVSLNYLAQNDFDVAMNIEHEIDNLRTELKTENSQNVSTKLYEYQISVTYMDIISECEKLGDYVINVEEALQATGNYRG